MNKRIQELSFQCWYNDPDTGKEEFDRTKFAELIVNEVFNRISEERFEVYEPVVQSVKQYFGIEQ